MDNNCNGLVDDACMGAPKTTKYHYNGFNQIMKSGVAMVCAGNDADCDGIPDSQDNCPSNYNPGQEDSDIWKPTALAAGAMGVWGFEEESGSVAKDGMGNYDGTLLNNATRAAGRYGKGLKLDDVNPWVRVSNLPRPSGAFSAELWGNVANGSGTARMLDFWPLHPLMAVIGNKLVVTPPGLQAGTVVPRQVVVRPSQGHRFPVDRSLPGPATPKAVARWKQKNERNRGRDRSRPSYRGWRRLQRQVRQLDARSGGLVHRLQAAPRSCPCSAAGRLWFLARPCPARGGFATCGSTRSRLSGYDGDGARRGR